MSSPTPAQRRKAAKEAREAKTAIESLRRNCAYWLPIFVGHRKCRRPPIVALLLCVACIVVFYLAKEDGSPGPWAQSMVYIPGEGHDWYRPLSAMFSHVNFEHLWMNVVMLFLLGLFFEFTEGYGSTICVVWGAGTMGFAMHGVFRANTMVRGMSGAIYGIMAAQISLLALNWAEMPARIVRCLLILIMLGCDIGIYWFNREPSMSYSSHCFGALAGVFIALVLGRNVRFHDWEVSFSWIGFLGYLVLVVIGFAARQTEASALGAVVILPLLFYAILLTREAITGKPTSNRTSLDDLIKQQTSTGSGTVNADVVQEV